MSELVNRLRASCDMVVFDTPPVLQFADARLFARRTDGVVLVVRANKTDMSSAEAARQLFATDGTRLFGTILNGWKPERRGSYRYGHSYDSVQG